MLAELTTLSEEHFVGFIQHNHEISITVLDARPLFLYKLSNVNISSFSFSLNTQGPDSRTASPKHNVCSINAAQPLEARAQTFSKGLLGVGVDLIGGRGSIKLQNLANLLEVVDNRHAGLDKGAESLADALSVVVLAATGLATLEKTGLHDRFRAVEEEDELGRADSLLELDSLVHLAREAINEEAALLRASLLENSRHGVLEESNSHLHGNDEAVADVVLDEVTVLGTGPLLLCAQQVAGGKVGEAVLRDELGALGTLTGARAAEDEDDGHIFGVESGS